MSHSWYQSYKNRTAIFLNGTSEFCIHLPKTFFHFYNQLDVSVVWRVKSKQTDRIYPSEASSCIGLQISLLNEILLTGRGRTFGMAINGLRQYVKNKWFSSCPRWKQRGGHFCRKQLPLLFYAVCLSASLSFHPSPLSSLRDNQTLATPILCLPLLFCHVD